MLLAADGVLAVVYLDVNSPIRVVLVLAFLLVCPGMAWVRLLRLGEILIEAVLAIAVSIVVDIAVPGIMIYGGGWSAKGALAVVVALTLAGSMLEIARARRSSSREAA